MNIKKLLSYSLFLALSTVATTIGATGFTVTPMSKGTVYTVVDGGRHVYKYPDKATIKLGSRVIANTGKVRLQYGKCLQVLSANQFVANLSASKCSRIYSLNTGTGTGTAGAGALGMGVPPVAVVTGGLLVVGALVASNGSNSSNDKAASPNN